MLETQIEFSIQNLEGLKTPSDFFSAIPVYGTHFLTGEIKI